MVLGAKRELTRCWEILTVWCFYQKSSGALTYSFNTGLGPELRTSTPGIKNRLKVLYSLSDPPEFSNLEVILGEGSGTGLCCTVTTFRPCKSSFYKVSDFIREVQIFGVVFVTPHSRSDLNLRQVYSSSHFDVCCKHCCLDTDWWSWQIQTPFDDDPIISDPLSLFQPFVRHDLKCIGNDTDVLVVAAVRALVLAAFCECRL